jgi:hypothetical protein
MKKITQLLIFILIAINNIHSQDVGKNNEKYWYYRERLTRWFMNGIGPNSGQSMPAALLLNCNAS